MWCVTVGICSKNNSHLISALMSSSAHNEHSPLLKNHCIFYPTGLLADIRGNLIQKLEKQR